MSATQKENARKFSRDVVAKLRAAGFSAFLVGGCVRDLLLGLEPKDYDVATSATPSDVATQFPGAQLVGAQFGVALVHESDAQVEVATFRSDHDYQDGRRPAKITFEQDPKQDVLRRDFTINSLLLDPETGEVIDFAGGQADLKRGLIRAIGDPYTRFREDHLRLLRAVRFAARFSFTIEAVTFQAIREQSELLSSVAPERIREEFSSMLTGNHPRAALELLHTCGLLARFLPEVEAMRGVEQPAEFHPEGDVWTHTMLMLDGLQQPSITLALGVLFHDIGKPATFTRAADRIRFNGHVEEGVRLAGSIMSRLRYSNEEREQVLALIANHMKFKDVTRMKESTVKRFIRQGNFEEHLALHRLDCLSSHGSLDHYDFVRRKRDETPAELLKPAPLITGRDLIDAGYPPGPKFKEVLRAVEDAQLNEELHTPEEAMRMAQRLLRADSPE